MEYEEDEVSEFPTSEVDWGEESNHSWGGEEDHDHEPWGDQTDSEISFGDELDGGELEPEPPDLMSSSSNESWSEEEGRHDQNSWPEETDSQFSLGEEGHKTEPEDGEFNYGEEPWSQEVESEASYDDELKLDQEEPELEHTYGEPTNHQGYEEDEETDSQISLREVEAETEEDFIEEAWESDHCSEVDQEGAWPEEEELDSCQEEPYHIYFSGHNQGPEAYLRWERDMEEWFQENQIPHEERTAIAEQTLVDEAYLQWEIDAYLRLDYDLPDYSWEEMKLFLHKEFVEEPEADQPYYPRPSVPNQPRRWITFTSPKKTLTKAQPVVSTKEKQQVPKGALKLKKVEAKVEQKQSSERPKAQEEVDTLQKPSAAPHQGKCSNSKKAKEQTCYRCHKRGHFAVNCPSKKVLKETSLEEKMELPKTSESFAQSDLLFPNSSIMCLSLSKGFESGLGKEDKGKRLQATTSASKVTDLKSEIILPSLGSLVSNNYDLMQYWNNILVRHSFTYSVFNDPTSSIKHLIFFLSVKKETGARGVCTSRTAQDDKQVVIANNVLLQEEVNGDNKCEQGVFTKATTLPLKEVRNKPWRGVIASSLIKEEPPDAHTSTHINRQKYFGQGKFLHSHLCRDTNLLYFGAGEIVSRSKPFQEGEYDEDIKSTSAQEHRTKSLEEESMKLRRAKEARELSSAQVEVKIEIPSSINTWRSYSTHPELATKNNHPRRSPYEEDIEDTFWQIFNGPDGDMLPLIESFQPNQDEPRCKSNCFGFPNHHRSTANWIRFNPRSDQGVIGFTNRVNQNIPDLDICALIGGFRSNQKEISCKSTCYGILTQPGSLSNWNHINTGFGVEVIQLLNRIILSLPYLEAHGFDHLQTRLWRPGERSNRSGETSRDLGESAHIFPCTSTHRIRRILIFVNFPFPDAFTLGGITLQRLYCLSYCVLETFSMNLDVPRHHSFAPKLSRLKEPRLALFGLILSSISNSSICIHCCDLFTSFSLLPLY